MKKKQKTGLRYKPANQDKTAVITGTVTAGQLEPVAVNVSKGVKPRLSLEQQFENRAKYVKRDLKRSVILAGLLFALLIIIYLLRDFIGI